MRQVHYQVAASLDGYIAGPGGEYDWIPEEPDIDFGEIFARYDTLLMGRRTYEAVAGQMGGPIGGKEIVVFSRTLRPEEHPDVEVVADDVGGRVAELREAPGKDIWLFGGGDLFRSLLDLGLVDSVGVAVTPVLLGEGIPLLPPGAGRPELRLTGHLVYPTSGIVSLEYEIVGSPA